MTAVAKSLKDNLKQLLRRLSLRRIRLRLFFVFVNVATTKSPTNNRNRIRPKVNLKQLLKEASKKRSCFILSLRHYKNDAFSSRPERPGYKAKKKNAPSFYFAAIRSFNSIEVPSSRGGRSEAQHNAPRQGSAMPPEACQTRYNAAQSKNKKLN